MWSSLSAQLAKLSEKLTTKAKRVKYAYTPQYSFSDVWDLVHVMAAVAPRREVFAFRTPQSFEGWAVKTDRTIGGKTVAQADFDSVTPRDLTEADISALRKVWKYPKKKEKGPSELQTFMGLGEAPAATPVIEKIDDNPGCVHFHGELSLALPQDDEEVKQSGYACWESPGPLYPPLDLSDFDGLELRIKTDGRLYVAQIKVVTSLDEDLYQVIIPPTKPGEWTRVFLPWSDFVYTFRGFEEEVQIPLEAKAIEHVAILMAERHDGPFSFKIDWIHAIKQQNIRQIHRDRPRE